MIVHVGRSWVDTHLEDECPCPKEPCGLVNPERSLPDCDHHPYFRWKSMRQGHYEENCPGVRR